MTSAIRIPRRRFLAGASALPLALAAKPSALWAQEAMPTRAIPASGERIPVIGFGSTKAVMGLSEQDGEALATVLRALLAAGGRVVDTWSRDAALDQRFGGILRVDGIGERLFLATKVDADGAEAGRALLERSERLFGRRPDLVQVFNLRDVATHWPILKDWQAAGRTRYLGGTVATDREQEGLMRFMREQRPDFVQVNYSVVETQAETGVLPLAAELGIAVIVNRPFLNGEYFPRVSSAPLPGWAAEFDCASWAQFSLKYILAHPAVTCVLTETTNPAHLVDNAGGAFGRLPDEATRRRMVETVRAI